MEVEPVAAEGVVEERVGALEEEAVEEALESRRRAHVGDRRSVAVPVHRSRVAVDVDQDAVSRRRH